MGSCGRGSDTDVPGLFALPFPWTVGLAEPPLDLVSADGSTTLWEVGKAVRQALRADPNRDDVEAWLIQKRLAFAAQAEKA